MPARPVVPLSVRVISYKYERYLPQCLAAFAAQSVQPHSTVVSDDCSPPPHGQAFRDLAAQYPAARFRDTGHNRGAVNHVRDLLADLDAAYYILFSADDYLVDRDFLRDAVQCMVANPKVVVVYAYHMPVGDDGRPLRGDLAPAGEPVTLMTGQHMRDLFAFDNVVPAVAAVVRSAVHERVPVFPIDNALCHDWLHWYCLTFAGDFARINRTVTHYRLHGANLSMDIDRDRRTRDLVDAAYAALLAHQDTSAHDRALLRRGRIHRYVQATTAAQLWRPLVRHGGSLVTWLSVAEALTARIADRATHWQRRLHKTIAPRSP